MITSEEALAVLAERLETAAPVPDAKGVRFFSLAEDMRLGVEILPGDAGFAAWTETGTAEGREAEEKAAAFLRLRLARLRGAPAIEATRDNDRLLLFWRGRPNTVREWLDAVAALLNEAEAVRRVFTAGGARPTTAAGLFSGMMGRLGGS